MDRGSLLGRQGNQGRRTNAADAGVPAERQELSEMELFMQLLSELKMIRKHLQIITDEIIEEEDPC